MINNAQFARWELSDDRQEVYLFDISVVGHPTVTTLRLSTAPYKRDTFRYHPRVQGFELSSELEPGLAGQGQIDASDIRVNNVDEWGDGWRTYVLDEVTVRYGDIRWDKTDFRVIMEATVHRTSVSGDSMDIGIASRKHLINKTVVPADYSGNLNTVRLGAALTVLLTENGELSVDAANFTAFDAKYTNTLTIAINPDGENLVDIVSTALAAYPAELLFRRDGTAYLAEYVKPNNSSSTRYFTPSSEPDLEVIWPLGEITLTRASDENVTTTERPAIKSAYPNSYRSLDLPSYSGTTQQSVLANNILNLYDVPVERVTFNTSRSLANIELGDEIQLIWNRYGYANGKYGIVTQIRERQDRQNTIEAWFTQ